MKIQYSRRKHRAFHTMRAVEMQNLPRRIAGLSRALKIDRNFFEEILDLSRGVEPAKESLFVFG